MILEFGFWILDYKKLTILLFPLLLLGCTPRESKFLNDAQLIDGTGTVVFVDLEGGFFGIKGDDGHRYDVANLPGDFQQDGLRVAFQGRPSTNTMSMHMWGIALDIVRIRKLDTKSQ